MKLATTDRVSATLRDVFGFDTLRAGQADVIGKLLAGRSTVAIFPTGGGKSLCYQLPALLLDGLTLVVSPLIALMKDQIDFLQSRKIAAARLDSTLTPEQTRRVLNDVQADELRMLYLAPERLANERFRVALAGRKVAMLAIDEAHCLSEWGHNFRPDYLRLPKLAADVKAERVLCLTATATPSVAADIARAFRIDKADVVCTGFYRPNLELHVSPCGRDEKFDRLREGLRERSAGAAIVYVTVQKTAEEVATRLTKAGIAAKPYHAGLEADARAATQNWFMNATAPVVVATIAFGMGIDKSNLRYVYHYNLPKTIESYSQEVGRAGRDGKPATCEMLASPEDRIVLENFVYGDTPEPKAVRAAVADILGRGRIFDVSTYDLSMAHDIRPIVLETLLTYLELLGVIESTGPFFVEFAVKPSRTSKAILGDFDAERAAFLRRVFARMVKAREWLHLDVVTAATALNEPRERIIKALHFLEQRGDLELKPRGFRQGYRMKDASPNVSALADRLVTRVEERENREIERLNEMARYVTQAGCSTRYVLEYFGEVPEADCGHCGWCLGRRSKPLPRPDGSGFDRVAKPTIRKWKAADVASLSTPRQLARFLCGISSPATRGKLSRESDFGILGEVPFGTVLNWCEEG